MLTVWPPRKNFFYSLVSSRVRPEINSELCSPVVRRNECLHDPRQFSICSTPMHLKMPYWLKPQPSTTFVKAKMRTNARSMLVSITLVIAVEMSIWNPIRSYSSLTCYNPASAPPCRVVAKESQAPNSFSSNSSPLPKVKVLPIERFLRLTFADPTPRSCHHAALLDPLNSPSSHFPAGICLPFLGFLV